MHFAPWYAAPMKPSSLSAKQMAEIAQLHGELEERCELEPLMDTLVAEPVFEFHPPGAALVGGDTLRRYYTQFLERFMPLVDEVHMIGECGDAHASVREYQIRLRVDGRIEDHQLVAVMFGSGSLLGGERLYGSERLLRLMLGDMESELEPIRGVTQFARDQAAPR